MLGTKQNDARHDIIQVCRAERARKPRFGFIVIADADQIDIAFAVDLAAGEKEHVDAPLAGAVEQFARAVGEEGVRAAAEQRNVRLAVADFPRQKRSGCRNRRSRATATWRASPIRRQMTSASN